MSFNAGTVPMNGAQQKRIMAVLQGYADTEMLAAFAEAWQERVRRLLLEHADDPETIHVTQLAAGGNTA
ncbi:hypothetical protein [Nitrosococcus watsonii]|uniref:hypothetical protein n=1 Tax=Nitrosococcus watsonii TaxID=473531 RepID=UPI001E2870C6|nr:hypothetical protein [Nitrosococcus watsonii]